MITRPYAASFPPKVKMLPLTVWMNMPSFYQGDLFRALVASGEVDLRVVFAKNLPSERLRLGWQNDLSGYAWRFLDKRFPLLDAMRLAWSQRDRIHIVNGLWAEQAFAAALSMFALTGSKYAIYSEAPNPSRSRSIVKRTLQRVFSRAILKRVGGVLPVSHFGCEFYRSFGVSEEKIYLFGYFRSGPKLASNVIQTGKRTNIEVIFVGQLIYRKGLDLLLQAIAPLFAEFPEIRLTIIGSGPSLQRLQDQACKLGVIDHVCFEGSIPSGKVLDRLRRADLLVLPSRWDGWGMVVNEALSIGVPVIVSSQCGAADIVESGVNGYVFHSENVEDLQRCIADFIKKRSEWRQFRAKAIATGKRISAETVAPYLIRCLKHMMSLEDKRPTPPWMQMGSSVELGNRG